MTQTHSSSTDRPLLIPLLWISVCVFAVLPVIVARFPPLYDYYGWVLEGRILAGLVRGDHVGWQPLAAVYELVPEPIPNLAAPVFIALFNSFLSPLDAGRLFLAVTVLTFGLGFGRLTRVAQGHPTPVEFLGFAWAHSLFLYKGYLSYGFGVGLAFIAVGTLHRSVADVERRLGPWRAVWLAIVAALLFLCHLFGWLVFALAVAVYAAWLVRRERTREGALLAATLLPSLLMLARYASIRNDPTALLFRHLWDKFLSMTEPLVFFYRTDPLPPPFPLFWANLAALLAIAALVALSVRSASERRLPWPLPFVGLVLAAAAVAVPFEDYAEMNRPDERLILPAMLILLAAVFPVVRLDISRGLAAVGVCGLLFCGHAFEYRLASARLAEIEAISEETIPSGESTISVIVWGRRFGGACEPESGFSFGTPAVEWFPVVRLLESGHLRGDLLQTSLLRPKTRRTPELAIRVWRPDEIYDDSRGSHYSSRFQWVEVFGCRDHVVGICDKFSDAYEIVRQEGDFAILRRRTRSTRSLPAEPPRSGS